MSRAAVFVDGVKVLAEGWDSAAGLAGLRLRGVVPGLIRRLRDRGLALVLLSNEPYVACGRLTRDGLEMIHDRLIQLLHRRLTKLDAIYYCPEDPEAIVPEFRVDSDWRLPGTEMFLRAAEDLDLDLASSWTISVDPAHVVAGRQVGCATVLIDSRSGPQESSDPCQADYQVADLPEAVQLILNLSEADETQTGDAPAAVEPAAEADEDGAGAAAGEEIGPPAIEAPPMPGTAAATMEGAADEGQAGPSESAPESGEAALTEEEPQPPAVETESTSAPSAVPPGSIDQRQADHIETLLSEAVEQLRLINRLRRYDDWSLSRLVGTLVQVFALGMGVWAAIDVINLPPLAPLQAVGVRLGGVIVLQLLSLTLLVVATRGK